MEEKKSGMNGKGDERQMEFQLSGRHLALMVTGLALFGMVLFLLGRWSERMARHTIPPEAEIEEVVIADESVTDPAEPQDLTFYETLGKKKSAGFQESRKTSRREEEQVTLPDSSPPPEPSAPAKSPKRGATRGTESPSGEHFQVQVASTRNAAAAKKLSAQLRNKGYEARVETVKEPDGKFQYKVRVGDFDARGPAEKIAARLRTEESMGAWIVRVSG